MHAGVYGRTIAFGNKAQYCYATLDPSQASLGMQYRKGKGDNLFSGQ